MADEKVEQFLYNLRDADPDKSMTAERIRELYFKIYPEIAERIMYGGIMFSLECEDVGGIFIRKNHISVAFSQGFMFKDPNGFLEGGGKYRRHLKLVTVGDIEKKELGSFITQLKTV